jgi:phosphoserine phosphatase
MSTDGRFDLVTVDLDGTLLPDDTAFAAILRANGHGKEVEASDARFFAGAQDLEATFWEQWDWVRPLTLADLARGLRKAAWLPGIDAGVQALRGAGLDVCLLTDQPSTVTDFLGRWDLGDAVASPVTVRDGHQLEIDARFDKLANLQRRLTERGIPAERVCHVGNGANDVPVWKAVGGSLAVFAEPGIAAAAVSDLGRPASFQTVADAVLALHRAAG